MSEITMRGTRFNVIGLLRLMADEIEAGERRSATAFSAHTGDDPTHTFVVQVDAVCNTEIETLKAEVSRLRGAITCHCENMLESAEDVLGADRDLWKVLHGASGETR